jgi:hypothetical protein
MAGIRAEEVNRPREVRAYGLTLGIGGAEAIGWTSTLLGVAKCRREK